MSESVLRHRYEVRQLDPIQRSIPKKRFAFIRLSRESHRTLSAIRFHFRRKYGRDYTLDELIGLLCLRLKADELILDEGEDME